MEWAGGTHTAQMPRHEVQIDDFEIGQFPVTNAEWRCFMDAGGYENARWWDSEAGRAWREGEGTMTGTHDGVRMWRDKFRADPSLMDQFVQNGNWDEEIHERWRQRLEMSDEAFEAQLYELYPESRFTEPTHWRDLRFSDGSQPVCGISWFEARAYLRWLSAQSGLVFRLPTEVEWEAAARGKAARNFAYGEIFDRQRCNTIETHVRRPSPIGVFPHGDTPEGIADLSGNISEWTSTTCGQLYADGDSEYSYPYDSHDGREELEIDSSNQRIMRGGSWFLTAINARTACRYGLHPSGRNPNFGFRVVCEVAGGISE